MDGSLLPSPKVVPEAKVYTTDLPFMADQLAELDVLVRFIIDAAKTSKTFTSFQAKLEKELKEVKVTRTINVENFLSDQRAGYVVLVQPKPSDGFYEIDTWNEQHPIDYWVDEEGMPIIYNNGDDAVNAIPQGEYTIIRVVNLAERYESKKQDIQ